MTCLFVHSLGLATLAVSLAAGPARADLRFAMQEVGPDVVLSGSGTIDTRWLRRIHAWISTQSGINQINAHILLSGGPVFAPQYSGVFGLYVFGLGGGATPSSVTGDPIDFRGIDGLLGLPPGYVSGRPLSMGMTFAGQTFEGLGVTPGTYSWTIGSDADPELNSIELVIGDAAVPEPSTLALLAVGGLGLALRRRWGPARELGAFRTPRP